MSAPPVRAVLWDFDNTRVDTRARNRSVARTIAAHLTGRDPDEFAALRTQDAYAWPDGVTSVLGALRPWPQAIVRMNGRRMSEVGPPWRRDHPVDASVSRTATRA